MKSSLATKRVLAHSTNYTKGRCGYKICKITPHHMSGKLTGEQCAKIFQDSARKASANYCIGYEGDIVCNVEEENRAWTSSNKKNDCQAITIEVSNSRNGTDEITEKSFNALIDLCVDICKRYNFKLTYDGTKNGSLTRHNMFKDTDCPGKYLQSRFSELVKKVNERLEIKETYTIKYVQVNSELNVRKEPSKNAKVVSTLSNNEMVKVYEEKNGWSRIGKDRWVSSKYLIKNDDTNSYYPKCNSKYGSIKDALNSIKVDS